jgi:TldD protein
MVSPHIVQRALDAALSGGADFAEIFLEESYSSELAVTDSKLSKAVVGRLYGAGIRLIYGLEQIYVTTNDLSESGLMKAASSAASARRGNAQLVALSPIKSDLDQIHHYGQHPSKFSRDKKMAWLNTLDRSARALSSAIVQAEPRLVEKHQSVVIANSNGLWVEDQRNYVLMSMSVLLEDQGVKQESYDRVGTLGTSEFFETVDLQEMAKSTVRRAQTLVHANYAPAGEMPVVIGSGFGGVIFHEACGHGLETTSIAKKSSVFCDQLGKKIASECVTAVDDGTLANTWGSLTVDDEGMPTKKTVLIDRGVLSSYIVDQLGSKQTGFAATGSGRRQNYKFAPASRMRNTYIAAGSDRLEDMIRDIDHGLFAKKMGGGSVSPGTGDYNFGVQEAYLIRNGKIAEPVKGATLIGRGIDTLGKIVKVGDELSLEPGMCGSVSGQIPTTVGQPAITVSSILVGGRAS